MKDAFLIYVFTITVASASPVTQEWVQRYSGSGNGNDDAVAVATDTNENVFITGRATSTNSYPDFDYVTIKYSGLGVPLWTNVYDGPIHSYDSPAAVALDKNGNVFVTGQSYGTNAQVNFATIAYSNNGAPLWTNRFSAAPMGDDEAQGIAIDVNNDIYVIGYSANASTYHYTLIKYSNGGDPLWTNIFAGVQGGSSAVAIDRQGNVFATGASPGTNGYADYATLKYSNTGTPLWTNCYNGPGNYIDSPAGLTLDSNGNVFVTGSSYGNGSGYDYATLAYSSTGVPLWTNRYNGLGNDWDHARAIAVNEAGDVFVTGASPSILAGPPHYATVAYSPDGIPLWTNIYTAGVADDEPAALTIDKFGNVIVTGYSTGTGTSSDYGTVEYSGAGVPLWTNRYDGPASSADEATAIATDHTGNVVVTGISDGPVPARILLRSNIH